MFSCNKNAQAESPQLKIMSFLNYKHRYILHTLSDKAFIGYCCESGIAILHGGSFGVTLTVPLSNDQVLILNSPRHMKHSNCAVNSLQLLFHFIPS